VPPGEEVLFYISHEVGEARRGKKTENVYILFKARFISQDKRISESDRKGESVIRSSKSRKQRHDEARQVKNVVLIFH